MDIHSAYMKRCFELAVLAAAEGESPVGSVVVKNGIVLGEASEKSKQLKDITRHAEVLAMLDALSKYGTCAGATLYSNVEPCILCSYFIRHHRIAEVVFCKPGGELGGASSQYNLLSANISAWGEAPLITVYSSVS